MYIRFFLLSKKPALPTKKKLRSISHLLWTMWNYSFLGSRSTFITAHKKLAAVFVGMRVIDCFCVDTAAVFDLLMLKLSTSCWPSPTFNHTCSHRRMWRSPLVAPSVIENYMRLPTPTRSNLEHCVGWRLYVYFGPVSLACVKNKPPYQLSLFRLVVTNTNIQQLNNRKPFYFPALSKLRLDANMLLTFFTK